MSIQSAHKRSFAHLSALPTLASNRMIAFIGSSMVGVFLPIYIFEFFGLSLPFVLAWFAINFAFKLPFYVIAAKIFSQTGLVASMVLGTIGLIIFYWMFFLLDHGSSINPFFLMAIGIGGLMLDGVFYWSPYHIDFAKFSDANHRGKQLGMYYGLQEAISILTPITAAFILTRFGYKMNFFVGLLLTAASIIPLFFVSKYKVTYEFGYFESFRKLFSKKYIAMTLSMAALGAENIVGVIVWPIFLFSVFQGNYLEVGFATAVIVVISMIVELIVGRQIDRLTARKMLKFGSWIYALGWIAKGFVQTITGVFAASTFHSFGSIMMRMPLDTMSYQQAADSGHYIDEFTVLREMAIGIGRVVILIILIPVTMNFSIGSAFFIAAIVSLGVNWLARYKTQE
ncbi:hypothetical protein HYV69_01115 [Candidatus Uhrbacteria bacterium]|nr:hypothetical protein [Candidatus Uhrbacteria bacterium]